MKENAIIYGGSRRLLHLFALFCVFSTFILICIGGIVTSTGSGLAVPDWPTSYGYNMFLFPFSRWFGDRAIFYEHTHRVVASGVGFLMIALCAWLWLSPERKERPWLCWLGTMALVLVIFQGILGGLRVTEINNYFGLIHGFIAQSFLVLTAAIALFLSRTWVLWGKNHTLALLSEVLQKNQTLAKFSLTLTILVLIQLLLGASMRHQHNGLAIPDFPLAYGQVWPTPDEKELQVINQERVANHMMPVSASQIYLHLAHRFMACLIAVATVIFSFRLIKNASSKGILYSGALILILTVLIQFSLGVWTVFSNKAADIATAHVFCGALLLLETSLLTIFLFRLTDSRSKTSRLDSVRNISLKLKPSGQTI